MNYKILFIVISIFFINGCEQNSINNNINLNSQTKYKNTGFTLVYSKELKNRKLITKKIDNRALFIFHKNLQKNSFVKI